MKRKKISKKIQSQMVIPPLPPIARQIAERKFSDRPDDTPDNIMRNALFKIYGININDKKSYKEFVSYLIKHLSLLSTGGRNEDIFEPDFDTFFTLVVRSINSCGEMMALLEQNGIEYRPKWLDNNDEDEEE